MIKKAYYGYITELLPAFIIAAATIMILSHPNFCAESVRGALELCMGRVIPSLFPFMIISAMIVSTKILSGTLRLPSLFFSKLFKVSPSSFQAVIIGCFCGFPVGAASLFGLYKAGNIEKEETERLLPLCNLCSPAFVIFFSEKAFGDIPFAGVSLYLIQLFSSLLLMMITSSRSNGFKTAFGYENEKTLSFSKAFILSVKTALHSSITVCGFVITFYLINELILLVFGGNKASSLPIMIVSGLLEVTCGITNISKSSLLTFCIASFFICFGGLSTVFQTFAIAPDGISRKKYILGKGAMGIIGAISALPVFLILKFLKI